MYVKAEYDKKFNKKPGQRKKRAQLNKYSLRTVVDEKKVGSRDSSKNKV